MAIELRIFILLLCLIWTNSSSGQGSADSVRQLKAVTITQSRLNDYMIAAYQLPIDSVMLSVASNGSLTDLLRKQGIGHVRSYGPGGLATASFRGTGSSHTAVLWNGITLVSPLSGQLDLSLVPVNLFDDASIQTGGSTSLSGNGSIGGNINLNNNLSFNQGLSTSASTHFGSFGQQYYDAGFKLSNNRLGMSTKLFYTASDNDYNYINHNTSPPETQSRAHAAFQQHGLLQQVNWQAEQAGIFSLKFWYQESNFEIPNPTGIPRPSQATEANVFYRTLAGWNFNRKAFNLNYQGAFVTQDLDYADLALNQYASNRYNSTIQNIETNFNLSNNAQLTSGINYTWEKGIVDDFGGNSPFRNRFAFFGAYKFNIADKWNIAFSGREEIMDSDFMPFSPAISAKYNVTSKLSLFTNLSRNYRIPTFNDLYWTGSGTRGNPNLLTETSLSAEAGIGFENQNLVFKTVAFTNHIDDWIQWSPDATQIWTPQNIKKVWSRGFESQLSFDFKLEAIRSKVIGQYSFTKSTNEDIYENGNPNEIGKQLILTPLHEAGVTFEMEWKKFTVRVVNSYTGEQFNDSDNSPYNIVHDYLITNVWLGKTITLKSTRLAFTAEVNNVFNVDYLARPGYPMPLRNFKAGIHLNINKPNKV